MSEFQRNLQLVLRIVTVSGLISMNVMFTAIIYWKLNQKIPEKVQARKWIFVLAGLFSSALFVYLYYFFYVYI